MMNAERFTLSKLAFSHDESAPSLGAGQSINLLIKCPAASASFYGAVLDVNASATGTCSTFLFSAPTTSADGTARTPQNRSRLDTPPSCPVGVFFGPTTSADGTQLHLGFAGPSLAWHSNDWILKPGVNYLVRLTNTTGSPVIVTLGLSLGIIPNHDYLYAPRCNTGATPGGRRAKAQG